MYITSDANLPISNIAIYRDSVRAFNHAKIALYCSYPLVAQLVEQLPLKEMVGGSNPPERTRKNKKTASWQFFCSITYYFIVVFRLENQTHCLP